jgi:hypothetical protein
MDTAAGKAISAILIQRKSGEYVAKILAHHGSACLVNVFQSDKAAEKSAKRSGFSIDELHFQHARAGGGGYDKFTAALSGAWIDGHYMGDHCGTLNVPKRPDGLPGYPQDFKPPRGFTLANRTQWTRAPGDQWRQVDRRQLDRDETYRNQIQSAESFIGYSSCHRMEGLRYLDAKGYRVTTVI